MSLKVPFFLLCITPLLLFAGPITPLTLKETPLSTPSSIPLGFSGRVTLKAMSPKENIYCDGVYRGSGTVKMALDTGSHTVEVTRDDRTLYKREIHLKSGEESEVELWEPSFSKLITVGAGGVLVTDKYEGTHYHPIVSAEILFSIRNHVLHGPLFLFDPLSGSWKDTPPGIQLDMAYLGALYQIEKRIHLNTMVELGVGLNGGIALGKEVQRSHDSMEVYLFDRGEEYYHKIDTENDPYIIKTVNVNTTIGTYYINFGGPSVRLILGTKKVRFQAKYAQSYGFTDFTKDYSYSEPGKVAYIKDDNESLKRLNWYSPIYYWKFSIAHSFLLSLAITF